MSAYSLLAALPAILSLTGFVVYQLLQPGQIGDANTQHIIQKLRKSAPKRELDGRLSPRQVQKLIEQDLELARIVGTQDFELLRTALRHQFRRALLVYAICAALFIWSLYLFVRESSGNARDAQIADSLRMGSEAIGKGNYLSARQFFSDAHRLAPDDIRPLKGLGNVEFEDREFKKAANYYQQALDLAPQDGLLAYSAGQAKDASNDLPGAIHDFTKAADLLPADSALHFEAVFDAGLSSMVLWLKSDRREADSNYMTADRSFSAFIAAEKGPLQWAHFGLACLRAERSSAAGLAPSEKTKLQSEATVSLKKSFQTLSRYTGSREKNSYQLKMMKDLLTASRDRGPGEAPECPTLRQIFGSSELLKKELPEIKGIR